MKETSRFYSSLGLLVILNAIIKPVWIFGIDRRVQNEVGVEAYGAYFSVFNLSIVFSFLLDLGLTNYYNRQLAAKDESLKASAGSFIFIKLLFFLIYTGVVCLVSFISGITRWDLVFYVILIQALTSMFVFFRAIITSQQWFKTDAWLSVLDKLLMIIVCSYFLYTVTLFRPYSINKFLLLQVACTALAIFTALAIVLARKFHFSFQSLWPGSKVMKAAFPYAIIILLMSFHTRFDGFLLGRISGAEEAGKYAAAYRLLDAANMIGVLFATFLLPYIARHQSETKNIESVALNVRHALLVFSITVSCIVIFEAEWIQKTLYHHNDPASIEILAWCIPALIGYALVQVYGTILTATGHTRAFSYIIFVAIIINVILNVLFIPVIGAKASCQAAIISQGFCGVATMLYARLRTQIQFDLRSFLIYTFIGGLVCGFLYLSGDWPINQWLKIIIAGLIAPVMLWITRLVNLKKWVSFTSE